MQLAFDNWSGKALHSEKAGDIRKCSAVTSIYPRVKALEVICTQTSIKTVLEHIRGRKRELDTDALIMIFGESFLAEQGLLDNISGKVLPATICEELIPAVESKAAPPPDSTGRTEIVFDDEELNTPVKTVAVASMNKKVTFGSNSKINIVTLQMMVHRFIIL